ncbi:AfsA-related hotdog domain-containing protein [Streptomyces sp. NPDC090022]|uniref:AfsA-related hotdog domain-containing protein n=1 Tax=Streptomyces sp. NPDC090022 TaxID=3365920 RepID=UPI0038150D50
MTTTEAAAAQELLTGWRPTGRDRFVVTARWPHDHPAYPSADGVHDPLLLAETVRQAITLLCREAYDVPPAHDQLWDHFVYAVEPAALTTTAPTTMAPPTTAPTTTALTTTALTTPTPTTPTPTTTALAPAARTSDPLPTQVELHIGCADITRRRGRLTGLTTHVAVIRDGVLLGGAEAAFTIRPALTTVGADNTGIATDRTPSMALMEAARRAAQQAAHPHGGLLSGMAVEFLLLADPDAPCAIDTEVTPHIWEPDGRLQIRVTARQHGQLVFAATATAEVTSVELLLAS